MSRRCGTSPIWLGDHVLTRRDAFLGYLGFWCVMCCVHLPIVLALRWWTRIDVLKLCSCWPPHPRRSLHFFFASALCGHHDHLGHTSTHNHCCLCRKFELWRFRSVDVVGLRYGRPTALTALIPVSFLNQLSFPRPPRLPGHRVGPQS